MRLAFLLALALAASTPSAGTPAASADGPHLELDAKLPWHEAWEAFRRLLRARGARRRHPVPDDVRPRPLGGRHHRPRRTAGSWPPAATAARAAAACTRSPATIVRGVNVRLRGAGHGRPGRVYVSYEGFHRIRRYDDINGRPVAIPSHPDFARLQGNSGLEAIAVDRDGTLYAIPERSGKLDRPFPVYRLRGGRWDKPFTIPREGNFLVSDATIGPEGDLYVLERDFSWLGFRTRVRRFAIGATSLGNETTLLETSLNQLDNMEGISVWRDPRAAPAPR